MVYRSFEGIDEYLKLITRRIQRVVITQGPLAEKLNVAGMALKILISRIVSLKPGKTNPVQHETEVHGSNSNYLNAGTDLF